MTISVNTNVAALKAQSSLGKATNNLTVSMERLTSGYKINSSKDDAAGMAVSTKLNYKNSSLKVAQNNAQMGSSLLDTSESIMGSIQSNLQRIRDLTEQASNGTYGSDSLTAILREVQSRVDEITRMAASVEFNGKYLLNGSITEGINLQVGVDNKDTSIITLSPDLFRDATAKTLLKLDSEDISDKFKDDSTAREFLINIDDAVSDITNRVAEIGGIQQRLATVLDANASMAESVTDAVSSIQDADIAAESTQYVKQQILQQLSTSMLSSANQSSALALSLLS